MTWAVVSSALSVNITIKRKTQTESPMKGSTFSVVIFFSDAFLCRQCLINISMSCWDLSRKRGSLINDDAGIILFISDGVDGDAKHMKEALNLPFVESENHHVRGYWTVYCVREEIYEYMNCFFSHHLLFSWKNSISEIKVCLSKKTLFRATRKSK